MLNTKNTFGVKAEEDFFHPLDPLTITEIELASTFTIDHLLHKLNEPSVIITSATLIEPHKRDVLLYINSSSHQRTRPDRICEVNAISIPSGTCYIVIIEYPRDDPSHPILRDPIRILPPGTHPIISPEEIDDAELIVREDEHVRKLCEDVGVSVDQIACDGWAIGFDPDLSFATPGRFQQCLMYARPEPHANLYAHPLDFLPIVDTLTRKVIRIDFGASRLSKVPGPEPNGKKKHVNGNSKEEGQMLNDGDLSSGTTAPGHIKAGYDLLSVMKNGLDEESIARALAASGRDRIKPPWNPSEYLPELRAGLKNGSQQEVKKSSNGCHDHKGNGSVHDTVKNMNEANDQTRPTLRPLHVIQPEGPSFELRGNQLDWQNWRMHIGFNYREGLILNTISYKDDGVYRPIFYRMSLVEMVVPYAAPEAPHHSKFAFDVGEYGLGNLTNSLSLGCDCLGEIRYLDATNVSHSGKAVVVKNAICIHEEDAGLLWKHTEVRPGGRSHSVRSRKLVISFICTVANYDYMFYWNFFQDGSISLDTKLSGILNLHLLAEGEDPGRFGTRVAPQIVAHYHAHTFSLRVDPMIDGVKNSVMRTDVVPLAHPTGSPQNYLGNGFQAEKKILKTTAEGAQDYDHARDRSWTIINPNKVHYSTKESIGYRIGCKDQPRLLANMDSMIAKRAPFAKHDLFVTPYDPEQYYPAGKFVPGTTEAPEDNIESWLKGNKSIDNEDIVLYLTYGVNHLPTPEQFPIMPAEVLTVNFKPSGFFKMNPSLDIAPTKDPMSRTSHVQEGKSLNRQNVCSQGC